MAKIDKIYERLLQTVIGEGRLFPDPNRKGTNRLQIPDYKVVHNFSDGFPAITTKKLYWKGVVGELIWLLRGNSNIKYLVDNNINIWNKDAYTYYMRTSGIKGTPEEKKWTYDFFIDQIKTVGSGRYYLGDLGRVYGAQWREWQGTKDRFGKPDSYTFTDQVGDLIKTLLNSPMSSRKIVTAWNPGELSEMALPPCHWSWEILTEPLTLPERQLLYSPLGPKLATLRELDQNDIPKYRFTLKWNQRSVDTFLGLPFNIASYALLAEILGLITNMIPHKLIGNLSNVHIYEPHIEAVNKQLNNSSDLYDAPLLNIMGRPEYGRLRKDRCSLDNFLSSIEIGDFAIRDYKSYPSIKAEMIPYSE